MGSLWTDPDGRIIVDPITCAVLDCDDCPPAGSSSSSSGNGGGTVTLCPPCIDGTLPSSMTVTTSIGGFCMNGTFEVQTWPEYVQFCLLSRHAANTIPGNPGNVFLYVSTDGYAYLVFMDFSGARTYRKWIGTEPADCSAANLRGNYTYVNGFCGSTGTAEVL
jgi:hypothetical protein